MVMTVPRTRPARCGPTLCHAHCFSHLLPAFMVPLSKPRKLYLLCSSSATPYPHSDHFCLAFESDSTFLQDPLVFPRTEMNFFVILITFKIACLIVCPFPSVSLFPVPGTMPRTQWRSTQETFQRTKLLPSNPIKDTRV